MKRHTMSRLVEWMNDPRRKPLLLLGARQVGKTWLMNEFGAKYFKKVAYISFDRNERMKNIFAGDYDIQRLLLALQLEVGFPITPSDTLVVFDEIQACPRALSALKYFCEDAKEYAIIAAGSLLGVADHEGTGFPVGKVDRLYLYPMTFTEFLEATGNGQFLQLIQDRDWRLIDSFSGKLSDLLRQYYFVGGMPEAVETFVELKDFNRVRRVHRALIKDYRDDFGKHAPKGLSPRIGMIWDSIPAQLSKENKKFIFSSVQSGYRAKDLELSMRWLLDSGLIHHVAKVSKPALPIDAYRDGGFKVFFLDVGLLATMANLNAQTLLEGNRIFQEFKGALAEQYVQQQILAESGVEPYYWSAERSGAEIDFLIQSDMAIVPVEVKAEVNLQAKSLKSFCQKFRPPIAVRTSMGHYFQQKVELPEASERQLPKNYVLLDLPLYAISQIQKECEEAQGRMRAE